MTVPTRLRMRLTVELVVCSGICRRQPKVNSSLRFTLLVEIRMDGQIVKHDEYMTTQNNSNDLLAYLVIQANSGSKDWFGFRQQRILGINLAYKIAEHHADKLSPEQVADYAFRLNNAIFSKLVKGEPNGGCSL